MKPTLFVLAAGMGSRYGGLKQIDGLGPHGETIMDYSIYDAIRAGFGKVVFVIRRDFEEAFREKIVSKYDRLIPVELVFQSVDKIPYSYKVPEERTKPWGTNHAAMMGEEVIREPFAVSMQWWATAAVIPSARAAPSPAASASPMTTDSSPRWWSGPASGATRRGRSPLLMRMVRRWCWRRILRCR